MISERSGTEAGVRWWCIVHPGLATRCGYVEIPEDHPWREAETEYDARVIPDEAHRAVNGGLTWLAPNSALGGIFVAGFDCAHTSDRQDPSLPDYEESLEVDARPSATVKTADDVERDCRALAQIVANKPDPPQAKTPPVLSGSDRRRLGGVILTAENRGYSLAQIQKAFDQAIAEEWSELQ